jgi:hypothetical protein
VEYYPLIPAGAAETARIPVPAIAPGAGPDTAAAPEKAAESHRQDGARTATPEPASASARGPKESTLLLSANFDHVKSYAPHFRHGRFKIMM